MAAVSRNGIIGVEGKIPWKIPQDRQIFKALTNKKCLILGRRTFEEHPTLAHIDHASRCIIVSQSLASIDNTSQHAPDTTFQIARSFPEAMRLAEDSDPMKKGDDDCGTSHFQLSRESVGSSSLPCWVVGGQGIYEEALTHEAAEEVHLSVVDMDVDVSDKKEVARFPPQDSWRHRFEEVARKTYSSLDGGNTPDFTYHVYQRRT